MKKHRKKYEKPKKPYDKIRIERERELLSRYGLRRKREIWRAEAILRNLRRRARDILARKDPEKERELLDKVVKMGLLEDNPTLEDVLGLTVENILERRLQTLVYRLGLARTPKQARQFIVHGHVELDGRRVVWPGMLVPAGAESKLRLRLDKEKVFGGEAK